MSFSYADRQTSSFNSRSREGSDSYALIIESSPTCFNSRSREGSDYSATMVSESKDRFNSRSREGSDLSSPILSSISMFQFTLPRGERQAAP